MKSDIIRALFFHAVAAIDITVATTELTAVDSAKKLPFHCAVGSLIGVIGLVSANYICDDMAIGSKSREKNSISLYKSSNSESEQSLLHVMSLATRNIAHSFFN